MHKGTIEEKRKSLNISKRTMSKRFCLPAREYSFLEKNEGYMNVYLYREICKFLDIDYDLNVPFNTVPLLPIEGYYKRFLKENLVKGRFEIMYRTSESISQVGAGLLLDIMYCSRPIYCLFNFGDSWTSVECKVLAITNEQLMVSYETHIDYPVIGSQEGVKLSWIDIKDIDEMWFTDKQNAEFEAVFRNENTEG